MYIFNFHPSLQLCFYYFEKEKKKNANFQKCPPVKGYIRGIVYLTAYYIRDMGQNGCQVTYINHSDPKGNSTLIIY